MTSTPNSLAAALADRYELLRELGRGGMATVYLARDARHARQVAIKVLHPELAAVLGAERFLAEIKTTANLQHPHILPLFDSGSADGQLFYVMPFVEGETLRARLDRETHLPIADAVLLAREVADALQYAHERGVIHRDIKPENILLQGGHALVADFGIALAVQQAGGQRMTQTGLSLGTPQYMAPEQAMGEKAVDARADIYALGAVTYEMLAGEPPFTGPTPQAIVAKVMTSDPPLVSGVRSTVSAPLASAVRTALAKLPADRFADARAFASALQQHSTSTALSAPVDDTTAITRSKRTVRTYGAIAAVSLLAAGAAIAWSFTRTPASTNPAVRFVLAPPAAEALAPSTGPRTIAVSPDGSEVVYRGVSPEGVVLYRRRLNELTATAVPGTRGATGVLYAPDGSALLVNRDGNAFVVPLAGGEPIAMPAASSALLTWDEPEQRLHTDARGIWQTSTGGAKPMLLVPNDGSGALYSTAHLLPGGRALIAVRGDPNDVGSAPSVVAIRLSDGKPQNLGVRGLDARFVSAGFLVFGGPTSVLFAAPFDASSLTLSAEPLPVLGDVAGDLPRWAVSKNGVLAYLERPRPNVIASVDQRGIEHALFTAPNNLAHLRVSPRGEHIAYEAEGANGGTDVYVVSRTTKVPRRISRDGRSRSPEWSPDGSRLYWILEDSARTRGAGDRKFMLTASQLMSQPVDGSSPPARVTTPPGALHAFTLSSDGKHIAISVGAPARHRLLLSTLNSAAAIATIGDGVADVVQSVFSPDGKWLAYTSNESGRYEVSLTSIDQPLSPLQISTNGGNSPLWSPKSNTLYYSSTTHMLGVSLAFTPRPSPRGIDTLFVNVYRSGSRDREIDLDPLTNDFVTRSTGGKAGERIIVVTGWFDELRKRFTQAGAR